ncbi:hypothetical protein OJ253_225 [Cryptosporidium canis]|uniref:Uncharacterized protein n=1 Tax=Cryptosporidium canis TaxID=195482 RepID=A0A9D5HVZ9_9CRYT|nr:hypothetical protein OJ253_225 [Cryptosporidium canis]
MEGAQYQRGSFGEYDEMDSLYGIEGLNINGEYTYGEIVEDMDPVPASHFGVYNFDSDDAEISKEISKEFGIKGETDGSQTETEGAVKEKGGEDYIKTPPKRPFLRKGEGKSLVISNSRKANGESMKRGFQAGESNSSRPFPSSLANKRHESSNRPKKPDISRRGKLDSLFLGIDDPNVKVSNEGQSFNHMESEEDFGEMGWEVDRHSEKQTNNEIDRERGKVAGVEQERDYDQLIQQKLDLLDEKMEYIHQTHEEMMRKKTLLAKERKLLESHKVTFEKELRTKFEKSKQEIESEKRRLERENNKLTKDKIALNDQVVRLKMTIKAKDAEINRLTKEIKLMEKKEKERENSRARATSTRKEKQTEKSKPKNQKIGELDSSNFAGNSSITPLTTNLQTTTSISSNSSGSFIDRDLLIEEYLASFDFEKELDLLYGILSTCFEYTGEGEDFTTLPGIPNDVGKPWCDIEKPYKIQRDDDMRTITFKFPSGLVEIVFYDEQGDSVCPKNTRKLLWTHLGWCILVYPNGDIKAIKPDRNITYHYVEKDIVKCVVGMNDILNYDGEFTKLHLSKFLSLRQLQCVDPETRKTYIIHSDMSKQIFNG